jgi:hypothetical protein
MQARRIVVLLSLALIPQFAEAQSRPSDPPPVRVRRAMTNGPMRFEQNRGQADSRVRFLARGRGYQLFLSEADATFQFTDRLAPGDAALFRMQLVGAKTARRISGEERLAGVTNYLKGPAGGWKTGIPNFARVRYEQVYAGVDLVYYGNGPHLEYDFIIAPGANPSSIRLRFAGALGLRVAGNGDLLFRVGTRELRQPKPVAFQTIDGKRFEVTARYRLTRDGLEFDLGAYDRARTVTIDPVLTYSTYLGGTAEAFGGDTVAVDVNGNAYVGGTTDSADFPTTAGALRTTNNGGTTGCPNCDAFLTKYSAAGEVVYSTYVGGHGSNGVTAVAVDRWSHAYLAGWTTAPDLPTTPGAFQPSCVMVAGSCNVGFVAKLDDSGSAFMFSTYLGGAGILQTGYGTYPGGIALDDGLNIYLTGTTSPGFPVTPGAFQTVYRGTYTSGFVTKMNARGTALVYSSYLGGRLDDRPSDLAVDRHGNVYIAGVARSPDFPVTPLAFQSTCPLLQHPDVFGCSITFIAKLNAAGSALVYSTFLGGSGTGIAAITGVASEPGGIAIDRDGFAYVIGSAYTTDFPTTPGAVKPSTTTRDAFVTKLNRDGTALVYSTYIGGDMGDFNVGGGFEEGHAIAVDASGSAFIAGATGSPDFPRVDPVQPSYGGGWRDAYIAKLDPGGSHFTFATVLGGQLQDHAEALALDEIGSVYVTGHTESADFPVLNAAQPEFPGGASSRPAFVARIGEPLSCGVEATAQVQVFRSGYIPLFPPFALQFVIVWNASAAPINGPAAYVMDDLQNAVYAGSAAQTRCFSPDGDPLMLVPVGSDGVLAPNEAVLLGLWFYAPELAPIAYTSKVLSGYRGQ